MNTFITFHGHFYQPPRENPWSHQIDLQPSAAPYHDWNERITAECYEPNAQLGNYERINFNFGPTLLSWMQTHAPSTYAAILDADKQSMKRFNGHGNALAQCYNHMIMPLANAHDQLTQVIWGLYDFEIRFNRKPEGMWLPETAVDIRSLEVLADKGIQFTVLAPKQASKIRRIGAAEWEDVSEHLAIQTKRPYQCFLPSGKSIVIFFYDAYMALHLAFGGYIKNATRFIHGIEKEAARPFDETRIIHAAVDGETFGHHHKKGHIVLNKALAWIEETKKVELTNYSAFLERFKVAYEVEIREHTAWSCETGLNRWSKDDRHSYDLTTKKVHKWRGTLREALNWLRDDLIAVYEAQMSPLCDDPWGLRNEYIAVLLDPGDDNINKFLQKNVGAYSSTPLQDNSTILKLLEMQKFSMFMFTSCGWFFEDISRIEAIQILRYAAAAMAIAKEVAGIDLEPELIRRLESAESKDETLGNGRVIYEKHVQQLTA
jgi:alpha-amylase/alpha-mannosidase (GH57 family)